MKTSKKMGGVFVDVMGLRIKLWMEAVMEAAGVKEIPELILFLDIRHLPTNYSRWSRHEQRMTEPTSDFIESVERILPGTAEVFYSGPNGFRLWDVLEGDERLCLQIVDDEIFRATSIRPDESWSFHQRVMVIFAQRIPKNISLQKLWDMITVDRSREFHEDFNVLALTVKDVESVDHLPRWLVGSEENWERILGDDWRMKFSDEWVAVNDQVITKESSIVTLSVGQMVTTIALYVLSRKKNELLPHCHYLIRGILGRVINEQVSFGATLSEFLSTEEWAYKNLT
jgi:hypothetical protein